MSTRGLFNVGTSLDISVECLAKMSEVAPTKNQKQQCKQVCQQHDESSVVTSSPTSTDSAKTTGIITQPPVNADSQNLISISEGLGANTDLTEIESTTTLRVKHKLIFDNHPSGDALQCSPAGACSSDIPRQSQDEDDTFDERGWRCDCECFFCAELESQHCESCVMK